jgi:hypothetical protein
MPTPEELAMLQQYGGNDFQNQDWSSILKAIQGFNPDQYDGGMSYGMGSYTGPAIPGSNGWTIDEYQPGGGVTQLTRQASNQDGMSGNNRRFDTVTIGADGKPVQQWMQTNDISDNGSLFSNAVPIMGAILAAGGLSGAFGAGAGAAGDAGTVGGISGGLDGVAGDSAASWLGADVGEGAMAGFDALGNPLGGIPMTGPGGIGSVDSVAGALGPGAYSDLGYTGLSGLATDGVDQLANETNKLIAQNAAEPGTLLPTDAPFTDLSSGASIADTLSNALTPSNIKTASGIANALKGLGSGGSFGGGGGPSGRNSSLGGMSGVFNQVANETPGMLAAQAAPTQQAQQIAQALILGDSQPRFSQLQFNPIKLAQALQEDA